MVPLQIPEEELLPGPSSGQLSQCSISFPGYRERIGILMRGSERACARARTQLQSLDLVPLSSQSGAPCITS